MNSRSLGVTMQTVAQQARVSRATVSRVLSGSASVEEATRRRVLAACDSLGYVRNEIATQLARKTSDLVGLLLRETVNHAYAHLHDELQRAALARGLFVATMSAGSVTPDRGEVQHVHRLMSLRPAGLFIATGMIRSAQVAPFASQVPTVILPRPEPDPRFTAVSYDEIAHAKLMAEAILAAGHTRIAVVLPPEAASFTENLRATQLAGHLAAAGAAVTRLRGPRLTSDPAALFERISSGARARRFSAVAFPNDMRALDFVRRAQRAGLRVPDDIAVTGFDGLGIAVELAGLTTVRMPVEAVCRTAAEVMQRRIADPVPEPERHRFTGELLTGRTLG